MEHNFLNKPGIFGFDLVDRIEQAFTGVAIGLGVMFVAPTTYRKLTESPHKCDDVGESLHTISALPVVGSAFLPAAATINPQDYSIPFARELLAVQLATQTLSQAYETIRYFANNFTIEVKQRVASHGN